MVDAPPGPNGEISHGICPVCVSSFDEEPGEDQTEMPAKKNPAEWDDVWVFLVDGVKVKLNKAQRVALRSIRGGATSPTRFRQLEKKGLVVEVGEGRAWVQWGAGRKSIKGCLSPLGEKVFALVQMEQESLEAMRGGAREPKKNPGSVVMDSDYEIARRALS
jgi:hypothetical protein